MAFGAEGYSEDYPPSWLERLLSPAFQAQELPGKLAAAAARADEDLERGVLPAMPAGLTAANAGNIWRGWMEGIKRPEAWRLGTPADVQAGRRALDMAVREGIMESPMFRDVRFSGRYMVPGEPETRGVHWNRGPAGVPEIELMLRGGRHVTPEGMLNILAHEGGHRVHAASRHVPPVQDLERELVRIMNAPMARRSVQVGPQRVGIKGGMTFDDEIDYLLRPGEVIANATAANLSRRLGHDPRKFDPMTRYTASPDYLNTILSRLSKPGKRTLEAMFEGIF